MIDSRSDAHASAPMQNEQKTVVVAGAGYAGVLAVNRLAGRLKGRARVVLVSPGEVFTDRIRLHEAAARGRRVESRLAALLEPSIEHINAHVVALDAGARQLLLDRAEGCLTLPFDALILALGSRFAQRIPAHSRHALALANPSAARALAARLGELPARARIAVVGGGLTAIELSAEIAEAHPRLRVELVASELAANSNAAVRRALRSALEQAGVRVRSGLRVCALEPDALRFEDGTREPVEVSVLACGFEAPALGPGFALPRLPDGRVPVDVHLQVHGLPDVYAVGDLAAPPAGAIGSGVQTTRMACATALPLGAHAADQVVRSLQGRPLVPFRFAYAAQCISVGRRQGVVVLVDRDDRASGRVLTGRTGALVKELVCRFVLGAIRLERHFAGLYAWPGKRSASLLPRAPAQLPE
jgi:NADH dehydrogenase